MEEIKVLDNTNKSILSIDRKVFQKLCNLRNETHRNTYSNAIRENSILLKDLLKFDDDIPIHFFLLEEEKLEKELENIENERLDKLKSDIELNFRDETKKQQILLIIERVSRMHYFDFSNFPKKPDFSKIENRLQEIPRKSVKDFKQSIIELFNENGILIYQGSNQSGVMPVRIEVFFDGFCIKSESANSIFLNENYKIPEARKIFSLIYFFFRLQSRGDVSDYLSDDDLGNNEIYSKTENFLVPSDKINKILKFSFDEIENNSIKLCVTTEMLLYTLKKRQKISHDEYGDFLKFHKKKRMLNKNKIPVFRSSEKIIAQKNINFNNKISCNKILNSNSLTNNQISYRILGKPANQKGIKKLNSMKKFL